MHINDEKWIEIVTALESGINKANAQAAEHGTGDKFRVHQQTDNGWVFVFTEHNTGYTTYRKAIAREASTGELRSARVVRRKRQVGIQASRGGTRRHGKI